MANYQRNTAYNYESIAPQRQPGRNPAPIRTLPRKKAKAKARPSALAKIAVAGLIVFMVCFNLALRANIYNVRNEIADAQQEIEKLESENIRLQMEIENKISYDNIEEMAQQLGMQKLSKSQIHYIDTTEEDSAEILNIAE